MTQEMRCENRLHGILKDGILEIKCRSKFCGAEPGVAVLHRFDMESGALLDTKLFKDPGKETR